MTWNFAGSVALPHFKCEGGPLGQTVGAVLTMVLAGPETPTR
jgi:hypothetical protein